MVFGYPKKLIQVVNVYEYPNPATGKGYNSYSSMRNSGKRPSTKAGMFVSKSQIG